MGNFKHLLATLPVNTNLYRAYHGVGMTVNLASGGNLAPDGVQLLQNVRDALGVYARVPELTLAYREAGTSGPLTQRGARFRNFLQHNPTALGNGLLYIDHEIRPLRLNTLTWEMGPPQSDIRRDVADLLLDYQGTPVAAENKMAGDSWPTSALLQVLYYGSMLTHDPQRHRLRRWYAGHFASDDPLWLALIVEERTEAPWRRDLQQAIDFASDPETGAQLHGHFAGLLVIEVAETATGSNEWRANPPQVIPW